MLQFNNVDILNTVGDIHGDFNKLMYQVCYGYSFKNSINIVLGDIGMGFFEDSYYKKTFSELNKKLKKANNHLVFMRGNHDDPECFNNPKRSKKFSKSHIHLIPDYEVVSINRTAESVGYNILCVGGAISVDRCYRIARHHWSAEINLYCPSKIDDIKVPVSMLCMHTAPTFCWPHNMDGIKHYLFADKLLKNDVIKERQVAEAIYTHLIKRGHNIKELRYGHFHAHHTEIRSEEYGDCKIMLNDVNEFNQVNGI
jgi:hypothetical protein